jgi:putative hydrolase of the HAD superfamily
LIKAIIFDFHGVVFGKGTWGYYKMAGGDVLIDAEFIDSVLDQFDAGNMTVDNYDKLLSQRIGISIEEWVQLQKKQEVPDEDLLKYISEELKPNFKIGLISNANIGKVTNNLNKIQQSIFDTILVSAEVGLLKPDPEIFKLGAQKLGVKPQECIFIDDHEPFLEGAKRTGMQTILYEDFEKFKKELEKII